MFSDYQLHKRLIAAIHSIEIETPTEVQKKVIPAALEGCDIQISAETGSGKTLAYLLPLMHKMTEPAHAHSGSRALILLPTRELAQQTFKECNKLSEFTKAKAVLAIGGQETGYQASLLRRDPDVVIATPGRLIEHINKGSAVLNDIEILVIDEADRMLDMGFRDEVLEIVGHCGSGKQTILLSATLNHKGVSHIASQVLKEPVIFDMANAQTKHKNITQKILLSDNPEHKQKQLHWLLSQNTFDKAVVFANKRIHVTELCDWLQSQDIQAYEIHGEISQDERKHVISQFSQGRFKVLVATDVAARGLDIEGIELVVNFDMAHSGDEYVHRIGRTGRAGKKGTAISLVADYEWNLTAGIQRYLKQDFEPMTVPGLEGKYKGPTKLKSSGKAVGKKNRTKGDKYRFEQKSEKKKPKDTKNANKRPSVSEKKRSGWQQMTEEVKSGLAPPRKSPK